MIFASSNVLGIAVSDRMIACAEVSGRGSRATVLHTAIFNYTPELSLEKPQEIGVALAALLKKEGFTASRAVVGVPAKWVIAVEKDVPPAGREQMKAMLRMQAERLPLSEAGEVVYDYAGTHQPSKGGKVLLVAMLRKQLDRIETVIKSADLSLVAVTPTALALMNASSERGSSRSNAPMLMVGRQGAEVVWQYQGSPKVLRHFTVASSNGNGNVSMASLGTELRRAVAMVAPPASNGDAVEDMVLWDGLGLDDRQVSELSDRLGMKVQSGEGLSLLGIKSPSLSDLHNPIGQFAPAVALAMAGTEPSLLPFDFIDSRLAPPPVRRFGRKSVWAAAIATLIVIGLALLLIDLNLKQKKLNDVKGQRADISNLVQAAQAVKDRVAFSNGFLSERSPMLECLREVTLSFGQEEPIWVSEFSIEEDRDSKDVTPQGQIRGRLEGRATNTSIPQQLADRLRKNPKFSEVTSPSQSGGAGRQTRDQVSFSIKFKFNANK